MITLYWPILKRKAWLLVPASGGSDYLIATHATKLGKVDSTKQWLPNLFIIQTINLFVLGHIQPLTFNYTWIFVLQPILVNRDCQFPSGLAKDHPQSFAQVAPEYWIPNYI